MLFAAVTYTLGSSRPLALSSALLPGHTAAYLAAGGLVALGIRAVADRLAHPKPVDFLVEAVAGVASRRELLGRSARLSPIHLI